MPDRERTYVCDDCGYDLTLTPTQVAALLRWGNPVQRPPCPKNLDGQHRVSDEQLGVLLGLRQRAGR